ncbi:hypothetical protein B9Y57_13660 [Stenotrophomonas maltophilia]|nr:hypothetical protein B9Y57_13660 [Stenotrophomonas maltophilia]
MPWTGPLLTKRGNNMFEPSDLIHSYTRAQAIEDGVLVDVSDVAKEAGFKLPVAITRAAWARYVEVPRGLELRGQSVDGRLWDVLFMLHVAIKQQQSDGSELQFQLHVALPDAGDWLSNEAHPEAGSGLTRSTHRLVTLKALCGPGDALEPVVTIMLPNED